MNRFYTGLWVALLVVVGLAFGWYATHPEDPADPANGSAVESSPSKDTHTPETAGFPGKGYEVAQVRVGQKVEILDRPGGKVVDRLGDETMFGSPRVFPVLKPGPKWLGVAASELGNGVIGWIRYDPETLALGDTRMSIKVDLSDRKLHLMRGDQVVRDAVVSVGRVGNETPIGRFAVTDTIVEGLDPVYGSGAVALSARQDNLPAGWIGGNLIAIHGWAGPVGDAASGGCLRTTNEDVTALIGEVPLGAPVFISS